MKKLTLTCLCLSFATPALATNLDSFVGSYKKLVGTALGDGPVKCPESLKVVKNSATEIEVQSDDKDFDSQYSFEKIHQGAFGCINKGDPIHNDCYRTRFVSGKLSTDYGAVPNFLPGTIGMRVRESWTMEKKGEQLILGFEAQYPASTEAVGTCVYKTE